MNFQLLTYRPFLTTMKTYEMAPSCSRSSRATPPIWVEVWKARPRIPAVHTSTPKGQLTACGMGWAALQRLRLARHSATLWFEA